MDDTDLYAWLNQIKQAGAPGVIQTINYRYVGTLSGMQQFSATPQLSPLWQEPERKLPSHSRHTMPKLHPAQRHVRTLTMASVFPMRITRTPTTSAPIA